MEVDQDKGGISWEKKQQKKENKCWLNDDLKSEWSLVDNSHAFEENHEWENKMNAVNAQYLCGNRKTIILSL